MLLLDRFQIPELFGELPQLLHERVRQRRLLGRVPVFDGAHFGHGLLVFLQAALQGARFVAVPQAAVQLVGQFHVGHEIGHDGFDFGAVLQILRRLPQCRLRGLEGRRFEVRHGWFVLVAGLCLC